jgi:hypothetical protein
MTYPLVIEWWKAIPERQKELNEALSENLENPLIDTIVLLNHPDAPQVDHPKLIKVPLLERIKFNQTVGIINSLLSGRVCIFANTDIVFDKTVAKLDEIDWNVYAACLTRWFEYDHDWHPFYVRGSFDTWVFKVPLDISGNNDDFSMGQSGCDARIAYELLRAGRQIINPAWDIVTRHYHWSEIRTYLMLHMLGMYALVFPHYLGQEAEVHTYECRGDGSFPEFVYGTCAPNPVKAALLKIPAKPRS